MGVMTCTHMLPLCTTQFEYPLLVEGKKIKKIVNQNDGKSDDDEREYYLLYNK